MKSNEYFVEKEEYDKLISLNGTNLRVAIAINLMGWKQTILSNYPYQLVPPDGDGSKVASCPDYTKDYNAAALVRQEIAKRGLQDKFTRYLYSIDLSAETSVSSKLWQMWWHVADASPETTCRAALLALADHYNEKSEFEKNSTEVTR